MASHVEGQPGSGLPDGDKTSSFGGSLRARPSVGAKPLITPKPFSLQRNTTIRSIHAPKTHVPSSPSPSSPPVSIGNLFPGPTKPGPTVIPRSSPTTADAKPTRESAISKWKTESAAQPSDTPDSPSLPKAAALPPPQPSQTGPVSIPAEESQTIARESSLKDDKTVPPSAAIKDQVTAVKESTAKDEEKIQGSVSTSVPATEPKAGPVADQANPRDATPSVELQKSVVTLRRPKAIAGISEQKGEVHEAQTPLSPTSKEPPSPADPGPRRSLTRNRLSMELTKKFESGGQPVPSQPPRATRTKYVGKSPTAAVEPEKINPSVIPPSSEMGAEVLKVEAEEEDRTGGSSIKRRISLLFDSSSRAEVTTKREEPQVVTQSDGTGGAVKDRIKNWAVDANADTDNILQPQAKGPTKSFDSVEPPSPSIHLPEVEDTSKMPPVAEIPSEKAVDLPPEVLSAAKPFDDPLETPQSTSADRKTPEISSEKSLAPVLNRLSDSPDLASDPSDEVDPPANPLKDRTLRRSVRFGTVVRDDGGPPVLLGSDPESSAEEEEVSGDEANSGQTEEEIKKQEKELEKHQEFVAQKHKEEQREKVRRMEERLREEAALKEEERKRQREQEEVQRERLRQEERELEEDRERARRQNERHREEMRVREKLEEKEREQERLRAEERERERQREEERLKEEERERQREQERLRAEERERERQREEERLKEEEKERQREEERLRAEERERERQREEERLKEEERERQREQERLRADERERERQREEEKLKEEENERQRVQERLRVEERERERQREEERLKEEERERQRAEERLKVEEREREEEHEKQRRENEEMERERQVELMWQRQREEDSERARQKEERLREEERAGEVARRREEEERERLEDKLREEQREREAEKILAEKKERDGLIEAAKDRERDRQKQQRLREEQERERQTQEALDRKRAEELEATLRETERRRAEEERERERLREEREEEERIKKQQQQQQEEEERAQERKEELARRKQAEEEEATRQQVLRAGERTAEQDNGNLISFDSEDVAPKSKLPPTPSTALMEPMDVVYDDFSVKQPAVDDILFDDFSVKTVRWGSKSKVPLERGPEVDPGPKADGAHVALDVDTWTYQAPEIIQTKELDVFSHLSSPQEEPRSPYEILGVDKKEEAVVEEDKSEEMTHKEEEEEEKGDAEEAEEAERGEGSGEEKVQLISFSDESDDLDTEAVLNTQSEQQYADDEHPPADAESPSPDLEEQPGVSVDGVPLHMPQELPAFPESSTPLLDTHAQRSRAELLKRRSQRTRLPRTRQSSSGLFQAESPPITDWRACDTSDETMDTGKQKVSESEKEEEEEKEEERGLKEVSAPPPTSKRVPVFPGLGHSALLAQLKKKTGGGGGGGGGEVTTAAPVEDKAVTASEEPAAPAASQLLRSPRSAALLPGAARVLPPMGDKDKETASSPSWMQELKRKRMSQQGSGS